MTQLGKYWASVPANLANLMENRPEILTNSRVDIAGRPDAVGSSTRSVHWWMRIVFAAVFVLELAAHWV